MTTFEVHPEPEPATAATPQRELDLASRPDPAWLDEIEAEAEEVDIVLKCLARDSVTMCDTCMSARAQGTLDTRPVLARCASTKQPPAPSFG